MNINANPIGQDRYGSRIAINLISRSQRSPGSSGINRKREGESGRATDVPSSERKSVDCSRKA